MELLHEFAPKATRIAALVNPKYSGFEVRLAAVRDGTDKLGLQLNVYNVSHESEIDQAFAAMIERRTDALIITTAPILFRHKERLVELTERHALPAVYFSREFALAGGLMSYGSSIPTYIAKRAFRPVEFSKVRNRRICPFGSRRSSIWSLISRAQKRWG